jgi:hypothetical protein
MRKKGITTDNEMEKIELLPVSMFCGGLPLTILRNSLKTQSKTLLLIPHHDSPKYNALEMIVNSHK